MIEKTKKLLKHPMISGSAVIFIGSFIASILSYIFNLSMGRLLSVSDYGLLTSLTSVIALFAIFQITFNSVFARFSARYFAREDERGLNNLIYNGLKILFLFSIALIILLTILMPFISSFLKIEDTKLLFIIFFTLAISTIYSLPSGVLQGKMRFFLLAILNCFGPGFRFILGVILVLLGFKVFGALVGTFIAFSIQFFIAFLFIRKGYKRTDNLAEEKLFLKEFKDYTWKFLLASIGVTILSNTDIILVRHFFDPTVSGQYAALSIMGKAIFYLTSPIYFAFFPIIAYKKERKESLFETLLLASGVVLIFSVSLSFVYFLFPNLVLKIFFPAKEYAVLASYLGPFSLYILVFSLANLMSNFFLSIGKTGVYKINLLIAFLMILLVFIFHQSLFQIIGVLFSTSLLLLATLFVYYRYNGDH